MFAQFSLQKLIEDYYALVHIYANAHHTPPEHRDLVDLCALRRWIERQDLSQEHVKALEKADELVRQRPQFQVRIEHAQKELERIP